MQPSPKPDPALEGAPVGAAPQLSEMFRRLVAAPSRTRAARSVQWFGWIDFLLGAIILFAPEWVASLLHLPALTVQGANYLRLVGLLVSGLGMLYVVSGRLGAQGFIFASLLDRPLVPGVMAVLWYRDILPWQLALAFSLSDFGGFLWTLWAWRADTRAAGASASPGLLATVLAGGFGFTSGVVRNSRTFHPDGRVFRASVRSLHPADQSLARAADQIAGGALLRIGMGIVKTGTPRWLADLIPDAPSIAARFFSVAIPGNLGLQRQPEDLDLLCTAGGDRLWKLILNLATGGRRYGLQPYDYFGNVYFAQVPYWIDEGRRDVWVRFVPDATGSVSHDATGREAGLTNAVTRHAAVCIEVQPVGAIHAPFVPIAAMRFEEELRIDQEALHFEPVGGRGFVPHGFLTKLRKTVYPAAVRKRPPSAPERARRDREGVLKRLARYFGDDR